MNDTEGPSLRCKIYEEYIGKDPKSGKLSCMRCQSCPAGQEIIPRCELKILPDGVTFRCEDCKPEYYKIAPGAGRCKPCSACAEHQLVERQCTPLKNRICRKKTCEMGYYYTTDYRCDQCCPCLGDDLDVKEDACNLVKAKVWFTLIEIPSIPENAPNFEAVMSKILFFLISDNDLISNSRNVP